MTENKELYAALTKLQAHLPRIGKGETAKVPGKDGKQGYSYKYADLADVSQAILPLLASCGLSFTSKPTVIDGEFGLAYKLAHQSGEADEGFYPLPSPKSTAPQQVGSAITYARRYCLLAATGAAPDGEDDDAAAAQDGHHWQSAGEAFASATPARPRGNGNGQQSGQVSRPAAVAQAPAGDGGEPDADAQEYADRAHEARTLTELENIHKQAREAGKVTAVIRNPSTRNAGKLALYIEWRRKQLADVDKALRELDAAAKFADLDVTALPERVKAILGGTTIEDATPQELRQAAKVLTERAA